MQNIRMVTVRTHIVETIMVGMMRRGTTSNVKRDSSHAVGLGIGQVKVKAIILDNEVELTYNMHSIAPEGRAVESRRYCTTHSGTKTRSVHPMPNKGENKSESSVAYKKNLVHSPGRTDSQLYFETQRW
jgi:hypothetical protein